RLKGGDLCLVLLRAVAGVRGLGAPGLAGGEAGKGPPPGAAAGMRGLPLATRAAGVPPAPHLPLEALPRLTLRRPPRGLLPRARSAPARGSPAWNRGPPARRSTARRPPAGRPRSASVGGSAPA